jgi:hypothetical protein
MKMQNLWRDARCWFTVPAAMAVLATLLVFGDSAGASTAASRSRNLSVSANGERAGVGRVREPGPGGSSSVRGVGDQTINIAVFDDESNTVEPGQGHEFLQFAKFLPPGATPPAASMGVTSSWTIVMALCSTLPR